MMNKNIKLVVFINDRTSIKKNIFGSNIEILNKYFNVELWDIRCLKKDWGKKHSGFRFDNESIYKVSYYKSFSELKRAIINIKDNNEYVAFLFTNSIPFWILKIIRLIEKVEIPYFVKKNTIGFADIGLINSTAGKNIKSFQSKLINYFYRKIVSSKIFQAGLQGPAKYFAGTINELDFLNIPVKDENVVFTHSKDYDSYLRTLTESKIIENDYFVFIDQNFPFHPETIQLKINPEIFYSKILTFLNSISFLTEKKYVIALHPSSDPDLLSRYLPKDRLYLGKTIPLITKADFSIAVASVTSLASIITKSPIILLSSEDLLPPHYEIITKKLEGVFNTKALKYNEKINTEKLTKLLYSGSLYSNTLFEKYIKQPGSEEKLEYEIISEHILKYFEIKCRNDNTSKIVQ